MEGPGGGPDLVDPAAIWSPTSVASPSGIAYADGALWVATLRGRTLYEVRIAGARAAEPISHFTEDLMDSMYSSLSLLGLVSSNRM